MACPPPLRVTMKAADLKVQIVDVDAHQFADADARAEKEREDGQIAQAGVVVVALLMLRLLFAALHEIEQARDFVYLEADDRLAHVFWAYLPKAITSELISVFLNR